jgi:hypothetical protein
MFACGFHINIIYREVRFGAAAYDFIDFKGEIKARFQLKDVVVFLYSSAQVEANLTISRTATSTSS